MTRPLRRDARVKNASVITGVRLEAETAKLLCDHAVTDAVDERSGRGDVAQLARYYIRTGLGQRPAEANRREAHGHFSACVAGLAMEESLCSQVWHAAAQLGITKAGAVRHFIRLGLGFSEGNSLEREAHFAELADARKNAALGSAGQFRGTR